MTELDPTIRRSKAAVAFELRANAEDLHAQARTLEERAAVIERTWQLRRQTYPDGPNYDPLPTRAAERVVVLRRGQCACTRYAECGYPDGESHCPNVPPNE